MKNILKFIAVPCIALGLYACSSSQHLGSVSVVETNSAQSQNASAITYMLPKTVVKVEVEAVKTTNLVGPFFRYSQRFLNLSDVITEDSEMWEIKNVKIYTEGKADNTKQYSILTEGDVAANKIALTPDGVLKGFNLTSKELKPSPMHKAKCQPEAPASHNDNEFSFDNVPLSEDILLKTSSASMAQETANMIYQIRANRFEMLSGNIDNMPSDGEAYKLMMDRFDKLEADYVSLFAGKTIKQTVKKTFEFTPTASSVKNHVLFRFSDSEGVVDANDLSGAPVYLNVNVNAIEQGYAEESKNTNRGIYYYIPADANVSIVNETSAIAQKDIKLSQGGKIVNMPASILQYPNAKAKFCPVTGALIETK